MCAKKSTKFNECRNIELRAQKERLHMSASGERRLTGREIASEMHDIFPILRGGLLPMAASGYATM
jgi:hypothetical protein